RSECQLLEPRSAPDDSRESRRGRGGIQAGRGDRSEITAGVSGACQLLLGGAPAGRGGGAAQNGVVGRPEERLGESRAGIFLHGNRSCGRSRSTLEDPRRSRSEEHGQAYAVRLLSYRSSI